MATPGGNRLRALRDYQGKTQLEVELDANGKLLGGKIHAGRQEGRGIPVLDETGTAIKVVRDLSETDFGPTAPKISDDGTISVK